MQEGDVDVQRFRPVVFGSLIVSFYLAFVYAPREQVMGDVQRILYIHVPSAWLAFLAFFVVFAGSIVYLIYGWETWDRMAFASAEIGVLFTTITLISGSVWARFFWGQWWVWEPRVTTTLILWFLYVAYLVIRSGAAAGGEARLASIFGIIAFFDVPIVYFSVDWWLGVHPNVIMQQDVAMDPRMLRALIVSVVAFMLFYVYLLERRVALLRTEDGLQKVKAVLQQRARERGEVS